MARNQISSPQTTAIGSLPHHNVDAALAYAFQFDIPFLPQIPMRNAQEFMISQALSELPGLHCEKDGAVSIDLEMWQKGSSAFEARLDQALQKNQFEDFEFSSEAASCWRPFLWEVRERKVPTAKVQIAGPMTCQWVAVLSDGTRLERHPGLGAQIVKLITVRAAALVQGLVKLGTQPVIFLDEPALYAFHGGNPRHLVSLQELRFVISTLKKHGALVGLHCCSDTNWQMVLGLGLNILSLDTELSLGHLLKYKEDLLKFLQEGQRLSLGVIPTNRDVKAIRSRALHENVTAKLTEAFAGDAKTVSRIFSDSLLTPACGLALKSISEAEAVLAELQEFQKLCSA